MKKALSFLVAVVMLIGVMPCVSFAQEDSNVAKYFPLYGEYGFKDVLHQGEELVPPGDGNAIVGDDCLSLHRNNSAGNPDNTGHLVSAVPGEKISGDKISFSFNAKVDLNQSREVSDDEMKVRTIFLYGSNDYSKNSITLRYYYAENTSAVVLVQNGQDAVVATFKRPLADMWHNYAIALDGATGGKLTVYVDGEKVASVDSKGIGASKIGSDTLRLNRATSSNTINVDSYYRDLRFIKGVITESQVKKYADEIKDFVWSDLVNQTYVTDNMVTRTDINLPIGNGVKWQSSDETAINPNTGKVTRPAYGEGEKTVTLTMVYGNKKQSYNVILLPIDAGDLVLTSFDFDSMEEGSKIAHYGTAHYAASMTGYGQAANVTGDFKMVVNKTDESALFSGLDSLTISYDSKTDGTNTKPFITIGDKIRIVDAGNMFAVGIDESAVMGIGTTQWKKVTLSVANSGVKVYVDGEVIAELSGDFDVKSMLADASLTIGAGGEGLIDNVKVFSRSLTVDEINEYLAANVAPVMNASGGSEAYLVDLFEPVTITHPAGNAFIYYTTDGSEPTQSSNKYTGAFYCDGVANIKARAISSNGVKSEIAEAWVYNKKWAGTAAEFRIDGENTVNNIKIAWPLYPNATKYEVYRDGQLVGTTIGDAVDEYDLPVNKNFKYTIKAYNGDNVIAEGTTNIVTTFAIDVTETTGYDDNRRRGWVPTDENGDDDPTPKPSGYEINGKYYKVKNEGVSRELFASLGLDPTIWDNKCTCVAFYYMESDDGINWPEEWTPIYPIFIDLRFEGKQVGMHDDGESIIWSAHAEGTNGYNVAKLFFASFKPGRDAEEVQPYAYTVSGNVILPQDQPWEQYENYAEKAGSNQFSSFYIGRPFGYDSRDMVKFTENGEMYTFSATNMNQDMLILKLDDNWTKPEKVMQVALKGQRQESPAVFHSNGAYYIYTSTANGWFASQARYASTTALDQPWSPMRMVANAGTFASQANGVWGYGSESGRWVQRGHGYNWGQSGGWRKSNYQIFYHMAINEGVATGNWCYKMEYHPYWGAIAVQSGETVSLGKKATIDGKECPNLTDNVQLMRTGVTEVGHVPYEIIVDLEVPTYVTEVNLTNDIYNGSNCGSYFKVYGSNDESTWDLLADATSKDDDDPAFRSCWVDADKAYRYIKVDVREVNNLQNGNQSALWGGKPLEVAIYGKPEGWTAEYYDLDAQTEILVGYGQNNIDFTPYGQEPVIVNDRTLVPLRAIFEAMGAEVYWDDATRCVTATRGDTTVSLTIGSDQLYVNGEAVTIDVPAQIINDRTMIPVRAIAESFGCEVNWNQKAKRVAITE